MPSHGKVRVAADPAEPAGPGVGVSGSDAEAERARQRRTLFAAGRFVAALAVVIALFSGVLTPDPPERDAGQRAPANNSGAVWGPDVPFAVTSGGVPYAGDERWSHPDRVSSFTHVEDGLVYVEWDTSKIVFESWQHRTVVLGSDPVTDPMMRLGPRLVVGDPLNDVVAWAERARHKATPLVVVEASTGDELARTSLPVKGGVSILSVSGSIMHIADPTTAAGRIWSWKWRTDQPPHNTGRSYYNNADVSGQVWATVGSQLRFETASGQLLSQLPTSYADDYRQSGLSPDGTYWYSPAHNQAVVTATGELVDLAPVLAGIPDNYQVMSPRFVWTGESKLTVADPNGVRVCDVTTMTCGQSGIPITADDWHPLATQ